MKIIIPLAKRAIEIFQKIGRKDGYLFPCNSDAVTNRMLKEVAKAAGITEPIVQVKYSGVKRIEIEKPKFEFVSTHCARRTFTTLSLEKNMRPEIVMKITGHANYKTMEGYMKLVDSVVKKEMPEAWD
jgi:integrase